MASVIFRQHIQKLLIGVIDWLNIYCCQYKYNSDVVSLSIDFVSVYFASDTESVLVTGDVKLGVTIFFSNRKK